MAVHSASDPASAERDVQGTLAVAARHLGGRARRHVQMGVEERRMRLGACGEAVGAARDQLSDDTRFAPLRQVAPGMMRKGGGDLLLPVGQRDPRLDAVQVVALRPRANRSLCVIPLPRSSS